MKKLLSVGLLCFFLSGCVSLERQSGWSYNRLAFSENGYCSDVCSIFSCIDSISSYTAAEVNKEFALVEKQAGNGIHGAELQLVCLSLHPEARYNQFKEGVAILENMVTADDLPDKSVRRLSALLNLAYRLDRAKLNKWQNRKKLVEEKSALMTENKVLLNKLKQEQIKAKELQAQIEELKNIEKIINKREKS